MSGAALGNMAFLLRGDLDEEISHKVFKFWTEPHSDWVLENDKYYLVKYVENIRRQPEIIRHLTKRSRYARSGINSLGVVYDYDGNIYEVIRPDVSNRIYRGDKISQVTFIEKDIGFLYKEEILSAAKSGDIAIYLNGEKKEIEFVDLGLFVTDEVDEKGGYKSATGDMIELTLDENVKAFNGTIIDRKNFDESYFIDEKLNKKRDQKFKLGATKETIHIGSGYVGMLYPKAFTIKPVKSPLRTLLGSGPGKEPLSIHVNSPYSQPCSENRLVLEISREYPIVSKYYHLALSILKLKTPSSCGYNGKFKNQNGIMLPF